MHVNVATLLRLNSLIIVIPIKCILLNKSMHFWFIRILWLYRPLVCSIDWPMIIWTQIIIVCTYMFCLWATTD